MTNAVSQRWLDTLRHSWLLPVTTLDAAAWWTRQASNRPATLCRGDMSASDHINRRLAVSKQCMQCFHMCRMIWQSVKIYVGICWQSLFLYFGVSFLWSACLFRTCRRNEALTGLWIWGRLYNSSTQSGLFIYTRIEHCISQLQCTGLSPPWKYHVLHLLSHVCLYVWEICRKTFAVAVTSTRWVRLVQLCVNQWK